MSTLLHGKIPATCWIRLAVRAEGLKTMDIPIGTLPPAPVILVAPLQENPLGVPLEGPLVRRVAPVGHLQAVLEARGNHLQKRQGQLEQTRLRANREDPVLEMRECPRARQGVSHKVISIPTATPSAPPQTADPILEASHGILEVEILTKYCNILKSIEKAQFNI